MKLCTLLKKSLLILFLFYTIIYTHLLGIDNKRDQVVKHEKEYAMPLTEDLMREHGILSRVLLIYKEIIRRIENDDFQVVVLNKAASIIKNFIEEYHEKLEEDYIFPMFEKNKKEISLIKTLRNQHTKGRKITKRLIKISVLKNHQDQKIKSEINKLLNQFIKMYRPHAAREDTILFPEVRSLIAEKEFNELGEKFEDMEHKLFGEDGFESMVKKVECIERELGIYQLEQFTP
jgi:hemerythrin-like domain-containing protein